MRKLIVNARAALAAAAVALESDETVNPAMCEALIKSRME